MPYRRLPKTNNARLYALRTAVEKCDTLPLNEQEQVVTLKLLSEAKVFLNNFEQKLLHYQTKVDKRVHAGKHYKKSLLQARMYVSHFIQVLNMAVVRGEIKKEHKLQYQLDPENSVVPNLNREESVIYWGKNIIEGETRRIQNGGTPIYNPAIQKVRTYYEDFQEKFAEQKIHKKTTVDSKDNFKMMLTEADRLILNVWNDVEEFFKNEPLPARIKKCSEFGVVYYNRKGEDEMLL